MNLWPLKQLPLDQPASFCRERTTTIIMTREQFRIKSMRGPMNANKQNQKMGKAMKASQGHCGDPYLRIYVQDIQDILREISKHRYVQL